MTERLHFHFSLSCIGEGNGNPLQCSCLENPRDGGAWWAAVYGVAQSRTRQKRLSSSSMGTFYRRPVASNFGHLMRRADSFEKTPILGKIDGRRGGRWQRMRCWMASPTQWTWVWVNSEHWWWTERPGVLQSIRSQRVGHNWATELNWTDFNYRKLVLK